MTDGVPDVRALRKMSDLKSRLLTFKGWPLIMLSAKQLAEHGFYYTGISDIVTCFYCNISLGNWKINDDPLIEHKKFSPHCAYLELIKMKSIKPPNTTDETIEDEVLRQACELFSKSTVQKVAVANFRSTGQHFKSLEDVCEAVFKFDAKPAKSVTLESGNRVEGNEEGDICKICMDKQTNVYFFGKRPFRIKEEASTSPPPPRDSRRNSPRTLDEIHHGTLDEIHHGTLDEIHHGTLDEIHHHGTLDEIHHHGTLDEIHHHGTLDETPFKRDGGNGTRFPKLWKL
ncbi:baculoviral IAP repeat-containing protein 7-A [Trichonephila clavata]|uniref:Baculoviral IAP repeat-containing protein 7-A n=1 Tax=Trichonephila clavata TaxID=2740835 RepID=A0A8X6HM13_TRICU|nr:baculoviral IAP repeat-containing protein 7-A [Trichonephila clavata]